MSRGLSKQQVALLTALAHQWRAEPQAIDWLYGFWDRDCWPPTHALNGPRAEATRRGSRFSDRGLLENPLPATQNRAACWR